MSLVLPSTCLGVPLPECFPHAIDDDDIDAAFAVPVHQITLIKACCTVEINIIDTRSSTKILLHIKLNIKLHCISFHFDYFSGLDRKLFTHLVFHS